MSLTESGPGIGIWIALALGAAAGGLALYLGAGFLGFLVAFVLVSLVMALLLG